MHDDDLPVGRLLTRREAVLLLGAAGASLLGARGPVASGARGSATRATAGALPSCVGRPEQIEGPYFIDARLARSDIRADSSTGVARPGVPLTLAFAVANVTGGRCAPLAGALVDLWQADANGAYSGFDDDRQGFHTKGETWLRGQQVTDAQGTVRFTTIYPGWYRGRAVHLHFKVRTPTPDGAGTYEFTSQLYFDEGLNDRVHAMAPYASRGRRDRMNADDSYYRRGGEDLLVTATESGEGVAGEFALGLDLADAATGRSDGGRGRGVSR